MRKEETPRPQMYADRLEVVERVRLMRDGIMNSSGMLVSSVAGVLVIPLMLWGLGTETYGLWVTALIISTVVATQDFGLSASLTREIAFCGAGASRAPVVPFARSVSMAYLLTGAAGALLVASSGLWMSTRLGLSGEVRNIAPAVFLILGFAYLGDRLFAYAVAGMSGLRCFGRINALLVAASLTRALGFVGLLVAGQGIIAIAVWQVVVSWCTAFVSLRMLGTLEPLFGFRIGRLEWQVLRPHLPFSLSTQAITLAGSALWQAAPLLVGLTHGSAAVALYHVAQKIPLLVSDLVSRLAAVLLPAASEYHRWADNSSMQDALLVGTRWLLIVVMPMAAVLWVIAPSLLHTWLGEVAPGSILVFRLGLAAVVAEAALAGAFHVLWASGRMRVLLLLNFVMAAIAIAFALLLLPSIGMAGAAVGVCAAFLIGSAAYLGVAAHAYALSPRDLCLTATDGLWLPLLFCSTVTTGVSYLLQPESWSWILVVVLAGTSAYLVSFLRFGAREEERVLIREIVGLPQVLAGFSRKHLRGMLRRLFGRGECRHGPQKPLDQPLPETQTERDTDRTADGGSHYPPGGQY